MPRVPPWRWSASGPWPPEGTGPTQDEIRKRAHILATLDSSRSADENWIKAEKELVEPLPWSSFARWLGFSEKKGWDWLDFLCRLSFPAIIAYGGWYLSSQAAVRQQAITYYQRDFNITSEYMKEVKTLLLDKELNTRVLDPTHRRMIRNLTLSALRQIYDPGNRTLIARFLLCESDVEPIIISPAISWSSADLRATDLKGCTLRGADLRWANLQRADLRGKNTDLTKSLLMGANLSNADLRGANLRESNLFQAEMNGVLLNGADLSDADLSMADLSQSDLRFTNFVRANLGSTRRPPGPKNQNGAILREVNLEGAFLQRADLRDADLTGAHLAGADLRDGKLSGANLSRVTWNAKTQWPDLATMKQARNLPKLLREQLGI